MNLSLLAQSDTQAQNPAFSLLFIVGLFAIFYFLMIRPQQKRARAQQELASSVQPGDRIETVAGMLGTVRSAQEGTIDVEIASGVVVTMARGAVRRKVID